MTKKSDPLQLERAFDSTVRNAEEDERYFDCLETYIQLIRESQVINLLPQEMTDQLTKLRHSKFDILTPFASESKKEMRMGLSGSIPENHISPHVLKSLNILTRFHNKLAKYLENNSDKPSKLHFNRVSGEVRYKNKSHNLSRNSIERSFLTFMSENMGRPVSFFELEQGCNKALKNNKRITKEKQIYDALRNLRSSLSVNINEIFPLREDQKNEWTWFRD